MELREAIQMMLAGSQGSRADLMDHMTAGCRALEDGYATFRPRPDRTEKFDQQTSFAESKTRGISFLIGGNGAGTTEVAMSKVAHYLLDRQPPPRHDCPFWIIAGSYEQACETCWKEKLEGHGHLPKQEIDYDRIAWYKPTDNWPFRVPLKPWPGRPGRNWMIEFKSYKQGRAQMQSRSIGGFCFSEQFPWGLLTEVRARCREYNFPGGQFAEFTPVDPLLSYPLERMIEDNAMPKGWEVWRANTEAAMEAGHVSREWYEEFFSMVSPSMRLTRQIGAWAVYEGAIYPQFADIHMLDDSEMFDADGGFPKNVFHRRAIDWGSGPENPFACLWAYKNGAGDWFIYDEYESAAPISTIEHLTEIQERSELWGWRTNDPHYGATYADPSSPGDFRIAHNLSQYAPGVRGFDLNSASNAVLEGIEHVQWLLQPCVARNGKPRLFIAKSRCKNLARELRTYRWKVGTDKMDPQRQPVKKFDHLADCLRYLTFSEARQGGVIPSSTDREKSGKDYGVRLAEREGDGAHGIQGNFGRNRTPGART